MPLTLRDAWASHIDPDDYERHMAAVGQAQANAELLGELFDGHAPPAVSHIHFAGAGTGQFFDYFPVATLAPYRLTFTDINPIYLARLLARLRGQPAVVRMDDIEAPRFTIPADLIIVMLVLEHVDWRAAVAGLCRSAARAFIVIQENPPHPPIRPLPGTMSILREARPHLVDRGELIDAFGGEDFELTRISAREVPDQKSMVGLDFIRLP